MAAAAASEDAIVTLVTKPPYVKGAVALAESLRRWSQIMEKNDAGGDVPAVAAGIGGPAADEEEEPPSSRYHIGERATNVEESCTLAIGHASRCVCRLDIDVLCVCH